MRFRLEAQKKQAWLDILRSNKYPETFGCLNLIKELRFARKHRSEIGYVSESFIPYPLQKFLMEKTYRDKWTFEQVANWVEINL